MTLEEYTEYYYKNHNYAETLRQTSNDFYQLGLDEHAMKTMGGFGGAMFIGSV